jgi:hypothetical protein
MSGFDDAVDEACQAICEEYAAAGLDTMFGMCGNAGQEAIIDNASGDYIDAAYECSEGDASEFSTDHDDAVGDIVEVGNEYLQEAADRCLDIRAAAAAGEVIGDLSGFL